MSTISDEIHIPTPLDEFAECLRRTRAERPDESPDELVRRALDKAWSQGLEAGKRNGAIGARQATIRECLKAVGQCSHAATAILSEMLSDYDGPDTERERRCRVERQEPMSRIICPDCGEDYDTKGSPHDCEGSREEILDKLNDAEGRIYKLETALRNVIRADCCGCSVYGRIAAKALGLSEAEKQKLQADAIGRYDDPE